MPGEAECAGAEQWEVSRGGWGLKAWIIQRLVSKEEGVLPWVRVAVEKPFHLIYVNEEAH